MRCLTLSLTLCVLLVADTFGLYSDEAELMEELQAMQQGAAVSNDQQRLSGMQGSSNRNKQKSGRYNNRFDKPLSVQCNTRKGESLYKVTSRFSTYNKDRQWKWSCRKSASTRLTNCKWTSEVNDWQDTVRYMCPRNKIIAGLKSRHYNSKEDRRWRVLCCEAKGYHTEGCQMTRKLNQYKQTLSYQAPGGRSSSVLVGIESDFKKQYNDRRWQFIECKFVKDGKDSHRDSHDDDCDEDDRSKTKSKKSKSKSKHSKSRSRGCDEDESRDKSRSKSRSKSRGKSTDCSKDKSKSGRRRRPRDSEE